MPRGGRREGAGEKPIDGRARVKVSGAIQADLAAVLSAAAGLSGRSQSMLVNDAIVAYADTLRAIAEGAPVEQSVQTPGPGGYRPGSGRRAAEETPEITLPWETLVKLDRAVARTGRSRSSLVEGALYLSTHWLDMVGLPLIETAPAHIIELWRAASVGEGTKSPRPLPLVIDVRYRTEREKDAPSPAVCLVRDYQHGTWAVGTLPDGEVMGIWLRASEVEVTE